MKVGIPRALLYYEFAPMWLSFFDELEIEYIISPKTNKEIYDRGRNLALHEACLPYKIFLGHVDALIGKCDYILVPRIGGFGFYDRMCTRYLSTVDVVSNTFRDDHIKVLPFNVDYSSRDTELASCIKIGKTLKKKKRDILRAYIIARQAENTDKQIRKNNLKLALKKPTTKILLVGHKYNTMDEYIGRPLIASLEKLGVDVILATDIDDNYAESQSKELTSTMPWTLNRELLGSINALSHEVEGIILLSSFDCGPDSMSNEMVLRKITNVPILNLVVDGQEGIAGLETRSESFVDIILFKKRRLLDD